MLGLRSINDATTSAQLTDVLVSELMAQSNSLGLVFDRAAIHNGVLELLQDGLMDLITLR